jgi:hypothetical protein
MELDELTAPPSDRSRQGDSLVAALDALGVHFLWRLGTTDTSRKMCPVRLLALLACSPEARLRLAIIPLLLHRPDFSAYVPDVVASLTDKPQLTLKCFYTAARYLQWQHQSELQRMGEPITPLPDLFSVELELEAVSDPDAALIDLARRHAVLSREAINWLGTYRHAAERWLTRLQREREWTP